MINGDIWCDWDVAQAPKLPGAGDLAHLVLVPNPPQHPQGDFSLRGARVGADATAGEPGARACTFSGIGIYRPQLFAGIARGTPAKLAPLLRAAMDAGRVSGEFHAGRWEDVGTPQRLAALDDELRAAFASPPTPSSRDI